MWPTCSHRPRRLSGRGRQAASAEKAHTREGDAIAAARRRLPMVEVDASTPVIGAQGEVPLIEVFEGRSQLWVPYMMWFEGQSAAHQCEGCTMNITQVQELSYLHARDVTFAVLCEGPFEESNRYREFMGWEMPWYSVPSDSVDRLIAGRHFGMRVLLSARRATGSSRPTGRPARLRTHGQLLRHARYDHLRQAGGLGGLSPRAGRNPSSTPRRRRCAPTRTDSRSTGPEGGR
ncbi:MAG: DUF899 family protein [Thermomicrobiales bacterium]